MEDDQNEQRKALSNAEDVVRMVVRAFYEEETVIVMDGLLYMTTVTAGSIKDTDLATELRIQNKVVRRVLGQLETDNLVASVLRKETHGQREVQVQYWRVDHKIALDVIKLRLRRMEIVLAEAPVERVTKYTCNECVDDEDRHPSWDEHEVQELGAPPWACPHCEEDLEEESRSLEEDASASINLRFRTQLTKLHDKLKSTEEMTLPPPRAEAPPQRGQPKFGEIGHVPGSFGGYGDSMQMQQAKKIVLSLDGGTSQGPPAWQLAQASGSGTPGAASASNTGLGSFSALHSKSIPAKDDAAAISDANATTGSDAGGAAPMDAAGAEFIRQYQERCRQAQALESAVSDANATTEIDVTVKMEVGGEEEEEDEFEEEEEEILVMVAGVEMSIFDVAEEHEEKMSSQEYEVYRAKRKELE